MLVGSHDFVMLLQNGQSGFRALGCGGRRRVITSVSLGMDGPART